MTDRCAYMHESGDRCRRAAQVGHDWCPAHMPKMPEPDARTAALVDAVRSLVRYEDGTGGSMTEGSFLSVPTGITNALRAALQPFERAGEGEKNDG